MPSRLAFALTCSASAAALAALPSEAHAQREIVQPLPPAAAGDLNDALQRLARQPNDIAALIRAGEASLDLGDNDAAMGFFVRARDLEPTDPRAVAGLARAFLGQGRAVESLRFFAEAERLGSPAASLAADRGLATDLVGDAANAQIYYRQALDREDDPVIRRRLALSQAISGDKAAFEATLLPLLQAGDRAAFRTRSFGLAILGESEEAVKIADSLMPADMALKLAPYLRYMPRLTNAQQATAANLGVFPRADDIGRDAPDIAGYSPRSVQLAQRADAALTPSGPVMGSERPRAAPTPTPAPTSTPIERARPDRQPAQPRGRVRTDPMSRARSSLPPSAAPSEEEPAAVRREPERRVVTSQPAVEAPPAEPESQSVRVAELPPTTGARVPTTTVGRFDLSEVADETELEAETEAASIAAPTPVRVADAFADLGPATGASRSSGAVDVTAIVPRRETREPPPPAHPARHWVQVATGRDRSALAFDWRRLSRQSESTLDGKGPFVASWGETNRMLAGPYASASEAREIVNKLRGLGLDSFPWSSEQGEAVEPLD